MKCSKGSKSFKGSKWHKVMPRGLSCWMIESKYLKQNSKTLQPWNFECSPYLWGRWLLVIKTRSPRPPRTSADLRHLGCQKIMEGSVFRGLDRSQNLLGDLDLVEPGGLRSDLRGHHPRPKVTQIVFLPSLRDHLFYILQGRHMRPSETATSNSTPVAVWGRVLKSNQISHVPPQVPPILDFKPALAMYRPNYHSFSTSSQLSTLAIYRPNYHKLLTSSSTLAMYRPKYNQFKPTFNFNHAPPILNFKPTLDFGHVCTAPKYHQFSTSSQLSALAM